MKRNIFLIALLALTSFGSFAQRKKDLLAEIDKLRQELTTVKSNLNTAQQKSKISAAQLQATEEELSNLRETNTKLLENLGSITTLSKKKADNLGSSLESLKEKDKQLNVINKALSNADSVKLATLTVFKGAIRSASSNQANLGVINGAVTIVLTDSFLFGEGDQYEVTEEAKTIVEGIAKTLNENPDLTVTIEGNSNAIEFKDKAILDNWDLSAKRASAVVRMLQNDYQVDPKRLEVLGKSEYQTDAIDTVTRFIINPKFGEFYSLIKENMKNAAKE
ncbi:OmpA/MotB family protein [Aquimarina rhabdastrellae]